MALQPGSGSSGSTMTRSCIVVPLDPGTGRDAVAGVSASHLRSHAQRRHGRRKLMWNQTALRRSSFAQHNCRIAPGMAPSATSWQQAGFRASTGPMWCHKRVVVLARVQTVWRGHPDPSATRRPSAPVPSPSSGICAIKLGAARLVYTKKASTDRYRHPGICATRPRCGQCA